jgi:hypothetical protein
MTADFMQWLSNNEYQRGLWRIQYVWQVLPHGPSLTIAGCGKTQLAHTMAVIAQLPKVGFAS